jgi:hypothetical protein
MLSYKSEFAYIAFGEKIRAGAVPFGEGST